MAKKAVVELLCDRCGRTEYLDPKTEKKGSDVDLVLSFYGETVQYEDLCTKCTVAVGNYIKQITREAKEEAGLEDPTSPTPTTTEPSEPASAQAPR